MKVLVTGATGFVGGRLVHRLLAAGCEVTAAGRNREQGARLEKLGARFTPLLLEDGEAVEKACRAQQAVFHCGALSSPWGRYADFYNSNVAGTRHVINGCKRHDVGRLIHVSTPSVYFQYADRLDVDEYSPLPRKPANAYAHTKRLAEQLVAEAYAGGLPVVTIRPRAVYGPGDTALFPRLVRANERRFVPLFREGRVRMDITYVDNCVDALLLCLHAPERALGRIYNITNGEPAQFVDILSNVFDKLRMPFRAKRLPYAALYAAAALMELTAAALPGRPEPLLTRYTVGTLAFHQTLDISAARSELGYTPRIGNEQGIAAFADWWRETAGRE